MYKYISISAWFCIWVMCRFITWPDKWETLLWLPRPTAHTWYSLSHIKYKIQNSYLKYYCLTCAILSLIIILNVQHNDMFLLIVFIVHICISFWWPSFVALRIKWFYSLIIIILSFLLNIVIFMQYVTHGIIVLCILLQQGLILHLIIINGYCVYVLKNPVTHLHYVARESRSFNV